MDQHVINIRSTLTKSGYRITGSRQAIIEALVRCEGHVTADELSAQVQESAPHVGRMTVYRTLELLSELGVIRPIYQGTGAAHYIIMTGGSHHHLICTRCNAVIEFEHCTADELIQQLAMRYDFQISSHLLELHGLCKNCHAP